MEVRVIETNAGYEVRCHSCNVSFPPEEKVCFHCGGRLGRASHLAGRAATYPPIDLDEAELEEPPSRGLLRTGLGSVWIVLALLATCYRVCTG